MSSCEGRFGLFEGRFGLLEVNVVFGFLNVVVVCSSGLFWTPPIWCTRYDQVFQRCSWFASIILHVPPQSVFQHVA